MKIKAISLWQPWASLIAFGAKKYETRGWSTTHRGPLLICSALKRINPMDYPRDFRDAVYRALHKTGDGYCSYIIPYGFAVALVNLTDCIRTELFKRGHPDFVQESLFGDFGSGRYAWELQNIKAIEPLTVKGRQGIFEIEIPLANLKLKPLTPDL